MKKKQACSRVVDDLEAIPFFKRQIIGRPRLVVVQGYEKSDTAWNQEKLSVRGEHTRKLVIHTVPQIAASFNIAVD